MMHYGWNDGGWGIFWMLLSFGAVVALVWTAIRGFSRDDERREPPPREPKDVLAERFAKGEIDAVEYHERMRVLQGSPSPTTSP